MSESSAESNDQYQFEMNDQTATPVPPTHTLPQHTVRELIYKTLSDPTYSIYGRIWGTIVVLALIASIISYLLQTLPQFWEETVLSLEIIDWLCIVIFTFEYLARIGTAPRTLEFFLEPMNIVDLLSFFPFFVETALMEFGVAAPLLSAGRILRLMRLFRLLKLTKYSTNMQVIALTLRKSGDGFVMLAMILTITVTTFAAAIFYAEQVGQTYDSETKMWIRADGSPSPFQSIPHSAYWAVVTITTVGYGDHYPVTWLGKIIGSLIAVSGVLVLSFPIALFGSNFSSAYAEVQSREMYTKRNELKNI